MKQIQQLTAKAVTVESIATEVCAREGLDFESLDTRSIRGLVYYWCSECHKIHPLTDLSVARKRIKCSHCEESVKLYSNSNKYGKLRKSIFHRLLEMGMFKSEN